MVTFQVVGSRGQIDRVVRLAREIWQEHYLAIIGQRQIDYMLDTFQSAAAIAGQIEAGQAYFLARHRGQDIGYLAIHPDADGAGLKISKIYVRKAERGLGVGQAMLVLVEEICRRRGVGRIWFTVNKFNAHSIEWYSRMGFVNVGPVVQDIGGGFVMDDFRFEKSIAIPQ
jgi:GNAT superfamily N-acetyltransferase